MLRSALGKVAWVGRTASMVFGLALVLALIFGVTSAALSATGTNFILGKPNTAGKQTSLVSTVAKAAQSALVVVNNGTGSALKLQVSNTNSPPMKVNSSAKIANLNADLIDDREASSFADATHAHSGADITSGAVAEAYIDPSVARDTEVMDDVKANDGSDSGLDADKLDGLDSTELKPLTASANLRGEQMQGSGVVSIRKVTTGAYEVQFNRTVSNCPRVASIGMELGSSNRPDNPTLQVSGEVGTFNSTLGADKIGVLTRDSAGNVADRSFHLAVFC